jgi:alkylation response protein AidB-like acyl-CoA dehydrogenase
MALMKLDDSDRQLVAEIRDFLDSAWSPQRQLEALPEQHHNQEHISLEWERGWWKELAGRGWLGLGIPEQYGGSGGTPLQRQLFTDMISFYGAPFPRTATTTVAPALMHYASEKLKSTYLPLIASGEVNFCLGYTEPDAGTDLASLRTSAVRDGGDYVVTGQKIYTTRGHRSQFCWLAARTSTEGRRHDGISLFVLDMSAPGVELAPIYTVEGGRTNTTYLDGVRIPADHLVGEENKGWSYLGGALGFERIGNFPVGHIRRYLAELVALAQAARPDGVVPFDNIAVRRELAAHQSDLRALECCIEAAITEVVETGDVRSSAAAGIKVLLTELKQRMSVTGMDMLGQYGHLSKGSPLAPHDGLMEQMWRDSLVHTFGAGTNEVQRDIIATAGLGLPRSR